MLKNTISASGLLQKHLVEVLNGSWHSTQPINYRQ